MEKIIAEIVTKVLLYCINVDYYQFIEQDIKIILNDEYVDKHYADALCCLMRSDPAKFYLEELDKNARERLVKLVLNE